MKLMAILQFIYHNKLNLEFCFSIGNKSLMGKKGDAQPPFILFFQWFFLYILHRKYLLKIKTEA